MPVAKLMTPSTIINIRKPLRLSERCGVSTAEKIVGSVGPVVVRCHGRSLYRNYGAQDTTQGGTQGRPQRCRGERRRAACARRAAARRSSKVRASAWRPTRKPPPARCRNGHRRRSRKRSAASRPPCPSRKGELKHINPFTLLVAVVLSAQATDAGVNKATPALFAAADTPQKMAAFGEERVRELIKTIGLFRTKAKNVVALSKQAGRGAWRRGAAHARGAGGAARRRPQDRERRAQHRLRRADHRGRHPHLPRGQPDRHWRRARRRSRSR